MTESVESKRVSFDYLKTLEVVKKQYLHYLEVSEICKLPLHEEKELVRYQPPSPEHPLTTNRIRIK